MVPYAAFSCFLVVNIRLSLALKVSRQEHEWLQNSSDALHRKLGAPPMSKSEADENVLLSLHIAEAADSSSLAKDAFVTYTEGGKTVSATPSYFFFYGSSLGLYRDGENPPGDDDVDVAVPAWELNAVSDTFRELGITPIKGQHWGGYGQMTGSSFWGYAFNEKGTHVCFGPSAAYYRDAFPVEMLLPARKISAPNITALNGQTVNIPRRPEQVFPMLYGDSWRTPASHKGPPISIANKRYDVNCAVLRKGQMVS